MLAEWSAGLLGSALAIMAAQVFGHGGARVTFSCLLGVSSLTGQLLQKRWPGASVAALLRGSLLYLASLIVVMFCLGRLDLGTHRQHEPRPDEASNTVTTPPHVWAGPNGPAMSCHWQCCCMNLAGTIIIVGVAQHTGA